MISASDSQHASAGLLRSITIVAALDLPSGAVFF
jgi:hypothetical protein